MPVNKQQGTKERQSADYHGTFHPIQTVSELTTKIKINFTYYAICLLYYSPNDIENSMVN